MLFKVEAYLIGQFDGVYCRIDREMNPDVILERHKLCSDLFSAVDKSRINDIHKIQLKLVWENKLLLVITADTLAQLKRKCLLDLMDENERMLENAKIAYHAYREYSNNDKIYDI